jgi:hypothetical protein
MGVSGNDHKSAEQLHQESADASRQITLGATYAHYKDPAKHYKVTQFVVLEATDQIGVVYQALYDPELSFVRAVDIWMETVEWNGQTVPRFTKL